jgi:lipid-A-disaccharide synthase
VYKVKPLAMAIARPFIKTRYISLVNLLADTELYPEYLTTKDESSAISGHILGWLNDAAAHFATVNKLGILREKVARPGACERAAAIIATELKNPYRQAA